MGSVNMSKSPTFLYHYTNQTGLIGIIQSLSIWATKIHFLNDSTEFELALKTTMDLAKSRVSNFADEAECKVLSELHKNLHQIGTMNYCVCSFSTEEDQLSQWRAYAGKNGYALAFFTDFLREESLKNGFKLVPCVYDPTAQAQMLNEVIDQMLMDLRALLSKNPGLLTSSTEFHTSTVPLIDEYIGKIASIAPLIKDESFSEENEWRLVSECGVEFHKMKFRPGTSSIIPYTSLDLGHVAKYLHSVMVGPTPNPKLSADGVLGLLYTIGIKDRSRILHSKVPYRNW